MSGLLKNASTLVRTRLVSDSEESRVAVAMFLHCISDDPFLRGRDKEDEE